MLKIFKNFNILWLLFLCLLKILFTGRANKKSEKIEKILIIQTGKLGDMVCITPMFRVIKNQYPNCQLWVMGNKVNQELLRDYQLIDKYLVFNSVPSENLKILKQNNFSFATSVFPDFNALATMILADIKNIAVPQVIDGFCPQNTQTYRLLSKFVLTKPNSIKEYAPGFYLKLLETIDIFTNNTEKFLTYSQSAEEKINTFFQENNLIVQKDFIVCLAPSVGNKMKLWPAERFAKIADYIYEHHETKIILIGHGNDKENIDAMIKKMNPATKFINTYNLFNLDELKALIAKMNLFISVDTGTIYIAEAFKVPTIDIVGALDENCQPPNGPLNKIVKAPREKPATYILNVRVVNMTEALRQVQDITVEMVINKFEELVDLLPIKPKL